MNNNYRTKSRFNDNNYVNFLSNNITYAPDSSSSDSEFSDGYDRRLDDEFNMLLKERRKRKMVHHSNKINELSRQEPMENSQPNVAGIATVPIMVESPHEHQTPNSDFSIDMRTISESVDNKCANDDLDQSTAIDIDDPIDENVPRDTTNVEFGIVDHLDQYDPSVINGQLYENGDVAFQMDVAITNKTEKIKVLAARSLDNESMNVKEQLTKMNQLHENGVAVTPAFNSNVQKEIKSISDTTSTPNFVANTLFVPKRLVFSESDDTCQAPPVNGRVSAVIQEAPSETNQPHGIENGITSVSFVEAYAQLRLTYEVVDVTSEKEDVNNSVYAAIRRPESGDKAERSSLNDKESVQEEPSKTIPSHENDISVERPIVINKEIQRSKRRRLSHHIVDSIAGNEIENGSVEAHVERHSPCDVADSVVDLTSANEDDINSAYITSPLSVFHSTARHSTMPSDLECNSAEDESNWTDCSDFTSTFTKN